MSKQIGATQPTLSRWFREAGSLAVVSSSTDQKTSTSEPKKWTTDEKLRVVVEARGLKGDQLGELLRREGLHEDRAAASVD